MKEQENKYEKERTSLKEVKKILHMYGKEVNFTRGFMKLEQKKALQLEINMKKIDQRT